MIPPPLADLAALPLDRATEEPVYRQLYHRVRASVLAGTLSEGMRLPSARSLASQLGLARGTVEAAYEQLAGEGYIVSHGPAGTFVASVPIAPGSIPPAVPPAAGQPDRPAAPLPFQMGLPALDAFPRKLWSRLATRQARALSTATMMAPDPAGIAPLRQAIGRYLAVARGIAAAPAQIIVTAGFQGALGLVSRALLPADTSVWVEEPGYYMTRNGLEAAGLRLVPVPVDEEGLDVAAGIARAPDARLALVSPAHQSPLGTALSLPRRLQLLEWAAARDSWIFEDDYDSEFRYVGRPLPALKSLDTGGRVLYVGSFSKTLFPGLKLGYLVAPPALAPRLAATAELLQPLPAAEIQAILAAFLAEGHFGRHVRRMRQLYARRRAALATALGHTFGPDRVALGAGGMHVLLRMADDEDDVMLARACQAAGLAPTTLSTFYAGEVKRRGLLLSFTNLPVEQAPREVRRLAEVLATAPRP
jgi:GntR family transcriptional regulator/MocR family aminotransferase